MANTATHNAYRLLISNPGLTAEAAEMARTLTPEGFQEWAVNEIETLAVLGAGIMPADLVPAEEVDWTEVRTRMITRHGNSQ